MKDKVTIFLWVMCLLCRMPANAQNYVENPSFEQLTGCPDNYFQIYKAAPWFSPDCYPLRPDTRGYAVLFTGNFPCYNRVTGVPDNDAFSLAAHTGNTYGGIVVFATKYTGFDYRQYIGTKLTQPLQAGKTYYFSMYYSMAKDNFVPADAHYCFKTDSLGAYFSNEGMDKNPGCLPLPVSPQVHGHNKVVTVADKWQELTGCYTAKGGEQFITLGNYATNKANNCGTADTIGFFIFIDDVTVTPKVVKQIDTMLCSGKPLTINAEKFREEYTYLENWRYEWSDGATGKDRIIKQDGIYTLKVIKDCFEDVYTFNVTTGDCVCKDYTPTAFTPNGDAVNDLFSPRIICKAGVVTDYKFYVYNRWGQQVFYSTKAGEQWDGTFSGQQVPTGTYIYMVRYKSRSGAKDEFETAKGTITLIR